MGMFDKLKANLTGGGVKVNVDAPANIRRTDKDFQAVVKLKNTTKEVRQINSIKVRLIERREEKTSDGMTQSRDYDLSNAETKQQFDLAAGEEKDISITVPVSAANLQSTGNEMADKLVKLVGAGMDLAAMAADDKTNTQSVRVDVDVEGVKLDPNGSKQVELLMPHQLFGDSTHL